MTENETEMNRDTINKVIEECLDDPDYEEKEKQQILKMKV